MLKPINLHILIAPIKSEDFVEGAGAFDEVGEVLALAEGVTTVQIGQKVYFDSYLVARYPSGDIDKPYWLIKLEDVRAVE